MRKSLNFLKRRIDEIREIKKIGFINSNLSKIKRY
jgi:hypothetical protein